jgi:hypothetical protein
MERLREWADTVPPPPPLEEGADAPAEVVDAIGKAEKERELAAAKQEEQATRAEAPTEAAAPAQAKKVEPKIEVKAGEIDQETYDQLIAEGKSERIARSKAKAAWVKKEKARLRAEQEEAGGAAVEEEAGGAAVEEEPAAEPEAAAPAAPAEDAPPAPKPAEVHVEAGQIDQETYDQLIAEGKSERIARSKAKAAWVKKERARLRAEQAGEDAADGNGSDQEGDQ